MDVSIITFGCGRAEAAGSAGGRHVPVEKAGRAYAVGQAQTADRADVDAGDCAEGGELSGKEDDPPQLQGGPRA